MKLYDLEKLIKGIQECDLNGGLIGNCPYKAILSFFKDHKTEMTDQEFFVQIITDICNYAVENDMGPDDTLSTIADNIQAILKISTFNGWQRR